MARTRWIPRQHGAWGMLVIPMAAGMILRLRADSLPGWVWPFVVAVICGYLGFAALSGWFHSPRRHEYHVPMFVYGVLVMVAGLVTIIGAGVRILWWLAVALPLFTVAVWLSSRRKDRSLISGIVTAALVSGTGFVIRFPQFTDVLDSPLDAVALCALAGYFIGTVPHVKMLIRDWGLRRARVRSFFYHLIASLIVTVGRFFDLVGWAWPPFYTILTLRTWFMGRLHRLRPATVGLTETIFSLAAMICALT